MYVYIAIWTIGFLAYVIMSIRRYKEEIRYYLSKVQPENRREAKKFMLLENLLFVLAPEIAMIGMAIIPFAGIDIMDPWTSFAVLAIFAVIGIFSIGLSGIYGEKAQNLIPKEIKKSGVA